MTHHMGKRIIRVALSPDEVGRIIGALEAVSGDLQPWEYDAETETYTPDDDRLAEERLATRFHVAASRVGVQYQNQFGKPAEKPLKENVKP